MLEVENLDVFHGDAQALDGVSLEVEEGAIVAIVGANGAGKTSLIRTIAGMHRPARGRIVLRGADIAGLPSHRVCDLGIGQVAEGRQVFPTLTVAENLEMGALLPRARANQKQNLDRVLAMFPLLGERYGQAAGTLSGGEQQMLAIARCLMGEPQLVMFDEPSLGLAPAVVQHVLETIRDLNKRRADLRAGRAERRGLAQAREPRLCAGERPDHAVGHRRGTARRRPGAPGLSRDVIRRGGAAAHGAPRHAATSGMSGKMVAQFGQRAGRRGAIGRRASAIERARSDLGATGHRLRRQRDTAERANFLDHADGSCGGVAAHDQEVLRNWRRTQRQCAVPVPLQCKKNRPPAVTGGPNDRRALRIISAAGRSSPSASEGPRPRIRACRRRRWPRRPTACRS